MTTTYTLSTNAIATMTGARSVSSIREYIESALGDDADHYHIDGIEDDYRAALQAILDERIPNAIIAGEQIYTEDEQVELTEELAETIRYEASGIDFWRLAQKWHATTYCITEASAVSGYEMDDPEAPIGSQVIEVDGEWVSTIGMPDEWESLTAYGAESTVVAAFGVDPAQVVSREPVGPTTGGGDYIYATQWAVKVLTYR